MDERSRSAAKAVRSGAKLVGLALVIVALVRELRTPRDERTWHGRIGFVPYDLRFPTITRVRATLWNPDDRRVLVPRAFGVGWTVNFGAIWARLFD